MFISLSIHVHPQDPAYRPPIQWSIPCHSKAKLVTAFPQSPDASLTNSQFCYKKEKPKVAQIRKGIIDETQGNLVAFHGHKDIFNPSHEDFFGSQPNGKSRLLSLQFMGPQRYTALFTSDLQLFSAEHLSLVFVSVVFPSFELYVTLSRPSFITPFFSTDMNLNCLSVLHSKFMKGKLYLDKLRLMN